MVLCIKGGKKRYNGASSRAKDQLWVVHSLDPHNDLKTGDLRQDLILHAMDPAVTIRMFDQEEKRAESEFEREVIRILTNKGYRLRTQWKVGYYRIDIVVQGNGKRLALECDGDKWHPIEKLTEDMERQAILERLGWTFARIRGSAFYRRPEEALCPVFDQLDSMGIQPCFGEEPAPVSASTLVRELEDIIAADLSADETQTDTNEEQGAGKQDYKGNPKGSQEPVQNTPQQTQQEIFPTVARNWFDIFDEILNKNKNMDLESIIRTAAIMNGYKRVGERVKRAITNAFQRYRAKHRYH